MRSENEVKSYVSPEDVISPSSYMIFNLGP